MSINPRQTDPYNPKETPELTAGDPELSPFRPVPPATFERIEAERKHRLADLWHRRTSAGGLNDAEQEELDRLLAGIAVESVLNGKKFEGAPTVPVHAYNNPGAHVSAPVPVPAYQEALADQYAEARTTLADAEVRLNEHVAPFMEDVAKAQEALEETPEWAALQAAKKAAEDAGEAKAVELRVETTQLCADRCKDALVTLHGAEGVETTVETPMGRVSYRVTRGIHVLDHEALARDLLDRQLWAAYEAEVKVKPAAVRGLAEGKGALKGLRPNDSVSVAFTARKETA